MCVSSSSSISNHVLRQLADYGYAVQGVPTYKTLVLCHTGDDICAHGDLVLGPHMDYAQDALTAAEFVVQQLYIPQ